MYVLDYVLLEGISKCSDLKKIELVSKRFTIFTTSLLILLSMTCSASWRLISVNIGTNFE